MAVNDTWPWTPATTAQGFLSGRWLRRDGNVYGTTSTVGYGAGPNSAIEGGEDVNAKVDTSSGVPRSWPNPPSDKASTISSGQ